MKKLTKLLVLLLTISVFISGCGDVTDEKKTEESMVSTVSDNIVSDITSTEISEKKADDTKKNDSDTVKQEATNTNKVSKKAEVKTDEEKDKGTAVKKQTKTDGNKISNNSENSENSLTNKNNGNSENINKSDNNSEVDNKNTEEVPVVSDKMNWPDNDYTKLIPKPSRGVVRKADKQNGIYCILMTGADMVDAKAYAANLINCGFTSEVTETIETNTYVFGGGNSAGNFVVVSYQSGQFIIGIEK